MKLFQIQFKKRNVGYEGILLCLIWYMIYDDGGSNFLNDLSLRRSQNVPKDIYFIQFCFQRN